MNAYLVLTSTLIFLSTNLTYGCVPTAFITPSTFTRSTRSLPEIERSFTSLPPALLALAETQRQEIMALSKQNTKYEETLKLYQPVTYRNPDDKDFLLVDRAADIPFCAALSWPSIGSTESEKAEPKDEGKTNDVYDDRNDGSVSESTHALLTLTKEQKQRIAQLSKENKHYEEILKIILPTTCEDPDDDFLLVEHPLDAQ